MAFKPLTKKLIELIRIGTELNEQTLAPSINFYSRNSDIVDEVNKWLQNVSETLFWEGEELISLKIKNLGLINKGLTVVMPSSNDSKNLIKKTIDELILIAEKIEDRKEQKSVEIITIDDIDNFKELLKTIDSNEINSKFYSSAFLEDDVENTFLEILGEPYKENDAPSELRDLYTSQVKINGKRTHSAIMFKGRGVKKSLHISDCGKNGDQLLKLAKNTTATLYVVQHVNKIESEVIEALKHHLLAFSQVKNIKICAIDGKDTARILKAAGKNLEELMNKKTGNL